MLWLNFYGVVFEGTRFELSMLVGDGHFCISIAKPTLSYLEAPLERYYYHHVLYNVYRSLRLGRLKQFYYYHISYNVCHSQRLRT